MAVTTRIVKIGNSQGIRIPKAILDQLNFNDEIELSVEQDRLIICAAKRPRQGWEEQFQRIAERRND